MTDFKFNYDLRCSDIHTDFEVRVEGRLRIINREGEVTATFSVFKAEDNSEIPFNTLHLIDRAMISDLVHDPKGKLLDDAWQDYEESRQPQYDKYAGL